MSHKFIAPNRKKINLDNQNSFTHDIRLMMDIMAAVSRNRNDKSHNCYFYYLIVSVLKL